MIVSILLITSYCYIVKCMKLNAGIKIATTSHQCSHTQNQGNIFTQEILCHWLEGPQEGHLGKCFNSLAYSRHDKLLLALYNNSHLFTTGQ